ncbi:MAG: transcriptional regulator PpsR [Devosiaceae bacterium]|nr:transcriptional regulator PpsR [Devosiaceae bacterium MH13]
MLNPLLARSFKDPGLHLGAMDADAAATLLSAAADLALILDDEGIVLDMALSGAELAGEGVDRWIGSRLVSAVADDSRSKVSAILSELASGPVSRRRELNFLGEGDDPVPMNCVGIRLGDSGRTVLFGRDMRGLARLQQRLVNTQISMEREYTRLRQAEACYRLLFQLVGEAVIIVDASSMTVTDANPVAADLLEIPVGKMVGRRATHVFDSAQRDAVRAMLASAQSVGKAELGELSLGAGGATVVARASLYRQADVAYLLVRLLPADSAGADSGARGRSETAAVIDRIPDGFVLIDEQRRVKQANPAFVELVQAASFAQIEGGPIDTWFERSSVDANVLLANVREHGLVLRFPTVLRGELGATEDVEITAVSVPTDGGTLYGLVLRRTTRLPSEDTPITGFPAQSAEQLTDLIGHMPLKEVVRETTDVVERLCIEAALKLTGDNRASAAQMLGVSRQSLYAKMRRFGLGDLSADNDDP